MIISREKINRFAFYVLLFLLPTQLGTFFFMDFSYISGIRIDYLAPAFYATDLVAFILIISGYNLTSIISFVKIHKTSLIFLCFFVLINIIFAQSPPLAIYKASKYIELILLFLVLKKINLPSKNILLVLLCGALLQLLLALLQVGNGHAIQGIFYFLGERYMHLGTPDIAKVSIQGIEILRAYGSFSHPNSLAGFYILLYTFVLTSAQFKQFGALHRLFLACCFALIMLSFSKIALGVYVVITCAYLLRKKKLHTIWGIFFGTVGLGIFLLVSFLAQGDPLSFEKRWTLNINALSIIINNALTGIGFGNYLFAQSQFPIRYSYHFLQPVHNIFLLFIAEAGIFITGFCAFIIIKMKHLKIGFSSFYFCLAIIIATGLFDHYWLTLQQNMLLIPTVFALLSSQNERVV